jgi:hypothetical protein
MDLSLIHLLAVARPDLQPFHKTAAVCSLITTLHIVKRRLSEEAVIPKSNGHYPAHESNGHEQVKLLDAPSSKPMPKSKPVRYSIPKRKK